jgi:hypothetical protein
MNVHSLQQLRTAVQAKRVKADLQLGVKVYRR